MADGELLNAAEEERLAGIIRLVEHKTTGELRVHITKRVSRHGVMADAAATFLKLGMDKTVARNGVLLYVAAKDHELACIGDKGIHDIVGEDGWKKIIEDLRAYFAKGDYYVGLHRALEAIGQVLTTHFPGKSSPNELPDEISKS